MLFFASGLIHASWMARLPALQNDLGANTAQLGLALATMGAGTFAGMLLTGRATRRLDGGTIVLTSVIGVLFSLVWLPYAPGPVAFVLHMAVFGVFAGVWDAGMNIRAAALERRDGRHLMSGFHGLWSVGCVSGATGALVAAWAGVPVADQCAVVAVLALVPCIHVARRFRADARPAAPARRSGFRVPPRLRYLMGIILAGAIIEGAASDWLAVLLVNGRGRSHEAGAGAYLAFVTAMALGRLTVNRWCDTTGREERLDRVCSAGAWLALVGIPVAVLAPQPGAVYVGAALWGVGVSVIFPVVLSVAGAQSDRGSTVAVISSIGYGASMLGPAALGTVLLVPDAHVWVAVLLAALAAGVPLLVFRRSLWETVLALPGRARRHLAERLRRPDPLARAGARHRDPEPLDGVLDRQAERKVGPEGRPGAKVAVPGV